MSGLAFFKHKCFCNGWSEDHRKSDVTGNGIETEKSKRRRWWDYRKYPYFLFMCLVFQGKLRNWHIKSAAPSGDWQSNTVRLSTVESPHPKPISFCILDFSGVFKGGRWCDRPPPLWCDVIFFWLILHCFVGFISRLNRMKSVSRGMDVCIL